MQRAVVLIILKIVFIASNLAKNTKILDIKCYISYMKTTFPMISIHCYSCNLLSNGRYCAPFEILYTALLYYFDLDMFVALLKLYVLHFAGKVLTEFRNLWPLSFVICLNPLKYITHVQID